MMGGKAARNLLRAVIPINLELKASVGFIHNEFHSRVRQLSENISFGIILLSSSSCVGYTCQRRVGWKLMVNITERKIFEKVVQLFTSKDSSPKP